MTPNAAPRFTPLTGLYEPSAIVQLADGRFLIVEDEKDHPLSLVSLERNGTVESRHVTPGLFEFDDGFWKLDDLEGLTLAPSGWIYAVTSQSLDGDGEIPDHAACHLYQQDWGIPVLMDASGVNELSLDLRGV